MTQKYLGLMSAAVLLLMILTGHVGSIVQGHLSLNGLSVVVAKSILGDESLSEFGLGIVGAASVFRFMPSTERTICRLSALRISTNAACSSLLERSSITVRQDPLALLYFGDVLWSMGQRQRAGSVWSAIPSVTGYFSGLAQALWNAGQVDSAQDYWTRVVEVDPHSTTAWVGLAQCSLYEGNYPEALELSKNAVEAASTSWQAWEVLGLSYHGLNNFEGEVTALQTAIQMGARSYNPWSVLARTQLSMGRLEEANRVALDGVRRFPDIAYAYVTLGLLELEKQEFNTAEQSLLKALSLDPQQEDALVLLARLHALRSEHSLAKGYLDRLISKPGLEVASLREAISIARRNGYLSELQKACELVPYGAGIDVCGTSQ